MDRVQLLIICCAAFICICGEDEDSSCEVLISVRRGTTKSVSPGKSLKVECPIKHCGKLFNVTWCKLSNTRNCETISNTENIKITHKYDKEDLISYLSFERVSINDDGLYRCDLGHNPESVSHAINISVSEDHNKESDGSETLDHDDDGFWLPYFMICITILLLISTMIVLTHVCFHGWKRTWTCNNKNQEQEISTHMIPEQKTSAPSSPILRTQISVLNGIYSSSKPERTTSTSPALSVSGNRLAAANIVAKSKASINPIYAVINHLEDGTTARKYTCKEDDKTNYAVINVP